MLISSAASVAGLRRKRFCANALCGATFTITLADEKRRQERTLRRKWYADLSREQRVVGVNPRAWA